MIAYDIHKWTKQKLKHIIHHKYPEIVLYTTARMEVDLFNIYSVIFLASIAYRGQKWWSQSQSKWRPFPFHFFIPNFSILNPPFLVPVSVHMCSTCNIILYIVTKLWGKYTRWQKKEKKKASKSSVMSFRKMFIIPIAVILLFASTGARDTASTQRARNEGTSIL